MNDEELLGRFEKGQLVPFSHRDHIRVMYACRSTAADPLDYMRRGLRGLTASLGVPGKYHETLTVAWASLVAHHAEQAPVTSSAEFVDRHPELLRADLVADYYSADVLASDAARTTYVEPDRRPLPC